MEWISVNDRMPEEGVSVLTYRGSDGWMVEYYWFGDGWVGDYDRVLEPVTHWMPLTAPDTNVGHKTNEPMTIEELQKMAGQPVYVVAFNEKYKGLGGWCVMYDDGSSALVPGSECFEWIIEDYRETWIAYRRKPSAG